MVSSFTFTLGATSDKKIERGTIKISPSKNPATEIEVLSSYDIFLKLYTRKEIKIRTVRYSIFCVILVHK